MNDDGQLVALRYDDWKIVFLEQRAHGFDVWQRAVRRRCACPCSSTCARDPVRARRAQLANTYNDWFVDHVFLLVPGAAVCRQVPAATFKEFPPRQKAGSFNLDQVMQKQIEGAGSK